MANSCVGYYTITGLHEPHLHMTERIRNIMLVDRSQTQRGTYFNDLLK